MLVAVRSDKGDTIIEVLFAITVFALVAIGGLSIMNQGSTVAQRSLETTLARNEINAQADAIRFAYDAYITGHTAASSPSVESTAASSWLQMRNLSGANAVPFGELTSAGRCLNRGAVARNFVIDPTSLQVRTAGFNSATTYARYLSPASRSEGLWVQGVRGGGGGATPGYIDFHIQACWDAPGQSRPMTLGTIVRLYDPAL